MKPGWEVKALGEICTKIGSGSTPRGGNESYKDQGISLIRSVNVHDLEFRLKDLAKIDDEQADALSNVEVTQGDVLLNITGASVARCCVAPVDFLPARVNQHVSILRPKPQLPSSEFLAYLLVSKEMKDKLLGIGDDGGSTRQALTKAQLHEFPIPLPPLDEQKRIVAVLDAAFDGLSRARTHTETNLKNARELFELGATEIFRKHTEDCKETSLGKLANFRNGLNFNQHSKGEQIRFVGVGDFQKNFWVPVDDLKAVTIEGALSPNDHLRNGDILAVRSNGNRELIGRVMLAGDMQEPTSHSGFTIRIRLMDNAVKPAFVCHFLRTKAMRDLLTEGGGGANISNLNQKLLENLLIKVPSTVQQQVAITEIDALGENSRNLQSHYRAKLADLDDLRQALLQKAFAGELT